MITYHVLTPARTEDALAFWRTIPGVHLHSNGEDSRDGIDAYLRRNPGCSYLALDDNTIIGAVLAGHDGRRGFLNHLAVDPSYRRCGIGSELLRLAEEALYKQGIRKSALFVLKDNRSGIAFYQTVGWEEETIVRIFSHTIPKEELP